MANLGTIEELSSTSPGSDLLTAAQLEVAYHKEVLAPLAPFPLGDSLARLRAERANVATRVWLARQSDGEPIGLATVECPLYSRSDGPAWCDLFVARAHRRRGLGARLLNLVATAARDAGQSEIAFTVWNGQGVAFVENFRGATANPQIPSLLRLRQLPAPVIARWSNPDRGPLSYVVQTWRGRCPDALLETFAAAYNAKNSAPWGETPGERNAMSGERIRDMERHARDIGQEMAVWCAIDTATGHVAAFTDIRVGRRNPRVAWQEWTGTVEEHRGRGLSRLVKARAIGDLARTRPDLRTIFTINAASNAPMLSINRRLGFRPLPPAWDYNLPVAAVIDRAHAHG